MQKKISYAGIPDDVLDLVIGECYGLGDYTLRDELDKWGQDIIVAQYNIKKHEGRKFPYLEWFRAWTKDYSMCLVSSGFGDEVILALVREIPKELINERPKEKRRRTKRKDSKTTK